MSKLKVREPRGSHEQRLWNEQAYISNDFGDKELRSAALTKLGLEGIIYDLEIIRAIMVFPEDSGEQCFVIVQDGFSEYPNEPERRLKIDEAAAKYFIGQDLEMRFDTRFIGHLVLKSLDYQVKMCEQGIRPSKVDEPEKSGVLVGQVIQRLSGIAVYEKL